MADSGRGDTITRVQRFALTSGELGSAGGQTLIAALLPVLLQPHTPSTFWIGAVIASEGVFAVTLPYLAGAVSDSAPPRVGGVFGRRGRRGDPALHLPVRHRSPGDHRSHRVAGDDRLPGRRGHRLGARGLFR